MCADNTCADKTVSSGPFPFERVPLDVRSTTFLELAADTQLYTLALAHVAEQGKPASLCVEVQKTQNGKEVCCKAATSAGIGFFPFAYGERKWHALHQRVGQPVGTGCGPAQLQSLVIFSDRPNDEASLKHWAEEIVAASEKPQSGKFTVFNWHPKHQFWRMSQTCRARPIDSVVLPEDTQTKVLKDLDRFLSAEARDWYLEHGIPYKRSYIFYGTAGAGKTSLIQAIAGHYERNCSYVSAAHPDMTDESLRAAVAKAPADAIVVFEDIDSLFAKDRTQKNVAPLTFSGLLNALDGVGSPSGQIFVLTTNHRERLDKALTRRGRVDVHVEFSPVQATEMGRMFAAFYPASAARGPEFADAVRAVLGERTLSAAALQHYFILMRGSTAGEAFAEVQLIGDGLDEQEDTVEPAKEPEKEEKEKEPEKKPQKAEGDVHVHVHVDRP